MGIDVNEMRKIDAEIHELPLCNDVMTFYYDETGNCGKLILTAEGVNDETALKYDFILGGVAFDGEQCPADTGQLLRDLKLQPSIKELKFRHMMRGGKTFLEFMGNSRVTTYLEWLNNSGLYIHYATINNLYYGLVDLVDSIWEHRPEFAFSFNWLQYLKSELYNFCIEHLEEVFPFLYKYRFPNIARENKKKFCLEFCDFIQVFNDNTTESSFGMEALRRMLEDVGRHGEISLLYDNDSDILVSEYYMLYLSRCYTYKNAKHYFDFEKVIKTKMDETELINDGVPFKNYEFVESKENELTQVSDVFIGILSRVFRYLDSITVEDISKIDWLKYTQVKKNLQKLHELIIRADRRHPMLIQNTNDIRLTQMRIAKLELLIGETV